MSFGMWHLREASSNSHTARCAWGSHSTFVCHVQNGVISTRGKWRSSSHKATCQTRSNDRRNC